MPIRYFALPLLGLTLLLGACAHPGSQNVATGATIGGITGAIIGHQIDGEDGRYVGGALGALAGAAIGDGYNRNTYYSDQNASDYQYDNQQHDRYSHRNSYDNDYRYRQYNHNGRDYYRYQRRHHYQNDNYAPYPPRRYRRY